MRTTLDLDDALLTKAKALAAQEHITLTRLIEQGLALRLRAAGKAMDKESRPKLPVYAGVGGLRPAVSDSVTNRALLDAGDGRRRRKGEG